MTANPQRVDVARLSELLEKATPGPWSARENHFSRWEILGGRGILANVSTPNDPASPPESWRECEANAALIAEAITSLPALLQQLAELQDCLRYANRANATIKTMCSSAEAKLAERDAECERLRAENLRVRGQRIAALVQRNEQREAKEAAERAREESVELMREVLERDRVRYLNGECVCINHSRKAELEYESGTCPHQRIAAFLAANGGRDHG